MIHVFDDAGTLAEGAARHLASLLATARTFGLAGGSTPRRTYRRLAGFGLDWESKAAWFPDERWVPPGDQNRNATMAAETLGAPLTMYPTPWTDDPREAAAAYEQTLRSLLGTTDGVPRPEVVLLGLGTDGHTASLFPDTPAIDERERWYVANPVGTGWRLTATPALLWAAEHLVFLVAGNDKSAPLAGVLGGDRSLPATLVAEGARDVTWLVDREAAGLL